MVLKINNIDLFALNSGLKIAIDGLEIELLDIDGEGTERVESGILQRDKIAEAHSMSITLTPMKPDDLTELLTVCRKPFVTIQFSDPFNDLKTTTAEFYNSTRNVKILSVKRDSGVVLYDKVTLKFIGRGKSLRGADNW